MGAGVNKRSVKRTNALFLGLILLYLVLELFISVIASRNIELGLTASLVLSQASLIVPALVFIAWERVNLSEWVPFKKIKWSTFGLTILFTICINPFVTWINLLSQLFTTNIVAELAEELLEGPPAILLFIIGIIGPFCEEFTFRGVIYHGLRRSGRILGAIIVSGLFFGLMHMNLNQFSYALILGIAFAFLTEATGSLLPSLIVHLIINTFNVGLEYLADFAYSFAGKNDAGLSEAISEMDISRNEIFYAAGLYMIPALIGLALSIVVYIAICKREGTLEHIHSLFKKKSSAIAKPDALTEEEQTAPVRKIPVITFTGWLAIVLCAIVIFLSDFALDAFSSF